MAHFSMIMHACFNLIAARMPAARRFKHYYRPADGLQSPSGAQLEPQATLPHLRRPPGRVGLVVGLTMSSSATVKPRASKSRSWNSRSVLSRWSLSGQWGPRTRWRNSKRYPLVSVASLAGQVARVGSIDSRQCTDSARLPANGAGTQVVKARRPSFFFRSKLPYLGATTPQSVSASGFGLDFQAA